VFARSQAQKEIGVKMTSSGSLEAQVTKIVTTVQFTKATDRFAYVFGP